MLSPIEERKKKIQNIHHQMETRGLFNKRGAQTATVIFGSIFNVYFLYLTHVGFWGLLQDRTNDPKIKYSYFIFLGLLALRTAELGYMQTYEGTKRIFRFTEKTCSYGWNKTKGTFDKWRGSPDYINALKELVNDFVYLTRDLTELTRKNSRRSDNSEVKLTVQDDLLAWATELYDNLKEMERIDVDSGNLKKKNHSLINSILESIKDFSQAQLLGPQIDKLINRHYEGKLKEMPFKVRLKMAIACLVELKFHFRKYHPEETVDLLDHITIDIPSSNTNVALNNIHHQMKTRGCFNHRGTQAATLIFGTKFNAYFIYMTHLGFIAALQNKANDPEVKYSYYVFLALFALRTAELGYTQTYQGTQRIFSFVEKASSKAWDTMKFLFYKSKGSPQYFIALAELVEGMVYLIQNLSELAHKNSTRFDNEQVTVQDDLLALANELRANLKEMKRINVGSGNLDKKNHSLMISILESIKDFSQSQSLGPQMDKMINRPYEEGKVRDMPFRVLLKIAIACLVELNFHFQKYSSEEAVDRSEETVYQVHPISITRARGYEQIESPREGIRSASNSLTQRSVPRNDPATRHHSIDHSDSAANSPLLPASRAPGNNM